MKTKEKDTDQYFYQRYRKVLKRPSLSEKEIDQMRIRMRMIAEAVLDYLSKFEK